MSARRYVALLRGVNVGGRGKVAMDALRASFTRAGYSDVATYIQSGNVVFSAGTEPDAEDLSARLDADLGTATTVILRSAADLSRIVAANPFPGAAGRPSTLLVTFLGGPADPAAAAALAPPAGETGRFTMIRAEIYLHCPDGYGRTKLTNPFFERRLGVEATTRNWSTVLKLRDMAGG